MLSRAAVSTRILFPVLPHLFNGYVQAGLARRSSYLRPSWDRQQICHFSLNVISDAHQWKQANEQGVLFLQEGQFAEAERALLQAVEHLDNIPASDPNFVSTPQFRATTMANLGSTYRRQGKPDLAVQALKDAISGLVQGRTQDRVEVDRLAVARAYLQLAGSHEDLGQVQDALLAYEEAKDMFDPASLPRTQCLISIAGLMEQVALDRINQDQEAEKHFPEEVRSGPSDRAKALAKATCVSYEEAITATEETTGDSVPLAEVRWSAATFARTVLALLPEQRNQMNQQYQKAIEQLVSVKDLRFMEVVDEMASTLPEGMVAETFVTPYAMRYNMLLATERGEEVPQDIYDSDEADVDDSEIHRFMSQFTKDMKPMQ